MEWILSVLRDWGVALQWFAGLAVIFAILGRFMPCNPGMYWWADRRAALTDAVYWFVVPIAIRACRMMMIYAGAILIYGGRKPDYLPMEGQPFWLQCLAVLVIQDVMLYWLHRAFHCRFAWPFHAVHHSPRVLDWTTLTRFHPVNNLLEFALVDVAVILCGFNPHAVIALVPFNLVYSAMVHANLNWTFGPLRYVLASPVFHRWHHTTQDEGLDKNFASTFPILDVIFGTFYMPAGKLPKVYGTSDASFPEGFWGQFFYPLLKLIQPEAASSPHEDETAEPEESARAA